MNVKDQNIYTDLFFDRPQRVLDYLDEDVVRFADHQDNVFLHDETPEEYYIPYRDSKGGAINTTALSKIMDVKKYMEKYIEEYGPIEVDETGVHKLSLIKLFMDFNNYFGVNIKVDSDDRSTIFVGEGQFSKLFDITFKNEYPSAEVSPKQKAFTNDKLIDAAKKHAITVLGEDQFESNPDAAKMIANDFIKGALHVLDVFTDADQDLVNLVDKDLEV